MRFNLLSYTLCLLLITVLAVPSMAVTFGVADQYLADHMSSLPARAGVLWGQWRSSQNYQNPVYIPKSLSLNYTVFYNDLITHVTDLDEWSDPIGINDKIESFWIFNDDTLNPSLDTYAHVNYAFSTAGLKEITWYIKDWAQGGNPQADDDADPTDIVPDGWDAYGRLYVFVEDLPGNPVFKEFRQDGIDGIYAQWEALDTDTCHISKYQYAIYDNGVSVASGYTEDAQTEIRLSLTLVAGHSYTMNLRGINVVSGGGPTTTTTNAVIADTTAPSTPSVSFIPSGTCTGLPFVVDVTPAADAESGVVRYQYKVETASGEEVTGWQMVEDPSPSQIIVALGDYSPGNTYNIFVQAQNGAGIWSVSGTASVSNTAAASSIGGAKLLADGSCVTLMGKVVTAGNDTIQGAFYVQEPVNSMADAGIKVVSASPVALADNVTLTGSMATDPLTEECYIIAGPVTVNYHDSQLPQIGVRSEEEVAEAIGCRVITSGIVHIEDGVPYVIGPDWPTGDRVPITTEGMVTEMIPDFVEGQSVYCEGVAVPTGSGAGLQSSGSTSVANTATTASTGTGGAAVTPSRWEEIAPLINCPLIPSGKTDDNDGDDGATCAGFSKGFRVIHRNTDGSGGGKGGIMAFEEMISWWSRPNSSVVEVEGSVQAYVVTALGDACSGCICKQHGPGLIWEGVSSLLPFGTWRRYVEYGDEYYQVHQFDTTQLHNGTHVIMRASQLKVDCDDLDGIDGATSDLVRGELFEVDNMVMINPTDQMQTIFYNGTASPVSIPFKLHDGLENGSTTVSLKLYKLPCQFDNGEPIPDQTVTLENLSSNYDQPITWVPSPALKRGLYAYKVEAAHQEPMWGGEYDLSGNLMASREPMTSHLSPVIDEDDSAVTGIGDVTTSNVQQKEDGQIELDLNYTLRPNMVFKDLQIIVKDSDGADVMPVMNPATPPAVAGATNTVRLAFTPEKFGTYYFMVVAKNDDITHDKAHRQKWMIANGATLCVPRITLLEPTETVGGKIPIRIKIETGEDCAESVYVDEIERLDEPVEGHDPIDWVSVGYAGVEGTPVVSDGRKAAIYRIDWDTLSVHNGRHTLRIKCTTPQGLVRTIERDATVQNLTVSATPDYLLYDPNSGNGNVISYTLNDACSDTAAQQTTVKLEIFSSDQMLLRTEHMVKMANASYIYEWDGKDDNNKLVPKGVYLYRITAEQDTQCITPIAYHHMDADCDKSEWEVNSTLADTIGENLETGTTIMRCSFMYATEQYCQRSLRSAKLEVFDPDLISIITTSVTGSLLPNSDIVFPDINILPNKDGKWRFLVSAFDNHPGHDRNHVNRLGGARQLLQKNVAHELKMVWVFIDAGHGGTDSGTAGSCAGNPPTDTHVWAEREVADWIRQKLATALLDTANRPMPDPPLTNPNDIMWRKQLCQMVPRYIGGNGRTMRADWTENQIKQIKPRYAVFISLHCNAGATCSTTGRSTMTFYRTDITDSQSMAMQLTSNISTMLISGATRSYVTENASIEPWAARQSMLRALASKKRTYTYKIPCNLLELVMLTTPDDENWIADTEVQDAFANTISKTYWAFPFSEINYDE